MSEGAAAGPVGSGGATRRGCLTPVVDLILLANGLVFALWAWQMLPLSVLAAHFLVSWTNLVEGRPWVLVTSLFSHNLLLHLLVNMIVLTSFGRPLERLMGSLRFLAFYLVAGVGGSLAHALVSNFLMDDPDLAALGASSALAGVLLFFSLAFPKARVLVFFILPLPALVAALAFVALDVWGLVTQIQGGGLPIGHGAHLGGAAVGVTYWALRGRRLRRRAQGWN